MKEQMLEQGRQAVHGLRRVRAGLRGDELDRLRERVDELEEEILEARQLHLRLAELTDVVEELLLPAVQRDEQKLAEALARYTKGL